MLRDLFSKDLIAHYGKKEEFVELAFPEGQSSFASDWRFTLIKFVFEVKPGDMVLVYDWKKDAIQFLGIMGDYHYSPDYSHIRQVSWIDLPENFPFKLKNWKTIAEIRFEQSQYIKNIDAVGSDLLNILNENNISHNYIELGNDKPDNREILKITELLDEFKEHMETDQFIQEIEYLQIDAKEFQEFSEKLGKMDKDGDEFQNHVLYGLLPCHDTQRTVRKSPYPVFLDIKDLFAKHDYSDQDWKNLSILIYELSMKFSRDPSSLDKLLREFNNSKYHQGFDCGSITPIFSALNDTYVIVNNKTTSIYKHILRRVKPGKRKNLSTILLDYIKNTKLIDELINYLDFDDLKNPHVFNYFVSWYDNKIKSVDVQQSRRTLDGININEDETPEEIEKITADVNIQMFLEKVKLSSQSNPVYSLTTPHRITIQETISLCHRLKWVIPNFQRYFDWNKKNVKELWESIFKDQYIGSYLMWETREQSKLGTIPILGVHSQNINIKPDNIILDGQQRITSIYYGVKAPNITIKGSQTPLYLYFNIKSYLEDEGDLIELHPSRVNRQDTFKNLLFPLYEFETYEDWIKEMKNYLVSEIKSNEELDSEKREYYRDQIDQIRDLIQTKLSHIWRGYETPYIVLPAQLDLGQVTEIFENINSKGKPLTVFDLLIARSYKYDIELKGIWDAVLDEFPFIKRYFVNKTEKMPIYILQTMSLLYHQSNSAKRRDILDIYENIYQKGERNFMDDWDIAVNFTEKALEKMENTIDGFGVLTEKNIPFTSTIPVLSALLKILEDDPSLQFQGNKKLEAWYWSAVFTNAYSSAAESQMTMDFRECKNWIFNDDKKIPKVVETARKQISIINLLEIQTKSNAKYLGVLGLIVLKGAHDFNTGLTPSNNENNEKDHIFPRAFDYQYGTKSLRNTIVNMTWNSKKTNRDIKRAKSPSIFIEELLGDQYNNTESELLAKLETHFINEAAFDYLKNNDFSGFIKQREDLIKHEIARRIGMTISKKTPMLIQSDTPYTNRLAFTNTINGLSGDILIIDKYFNEKALESLNTAINRDNVNKINILSAVNYIDDKFRSVFKHFRTEMDNISIKVDLNVISDKKDFAKIHDRFFIGDNIAFNTVSFDTAKRGQLSEITKSNHRDELANKFNTYWDNALDIIHDWNKIRKLREDLEAKNKNQ
jgi:hypothetical protein